MKAIVVFLITSFGARPGGSFLNTAAINKAIDACWRNGGGRVEVPAGVFRTGTIVLKDNVELHLDMGAVLLASSAFNDLPVQPPVSYRSQKDAPGWRSLIYANEASNIAITGEGTIDGDGAVQQPDAHSSLKGDLDGRPRNILLISCTHVRVEGITMRNAGIWNQHYLNCEDVVVDKVNVYNHANRNNDGIDIDGCRRFTLSNSIFDTDDDGIVLKSTGPAADEDIVITNCIVSSFCNAIKAGTESTGGFKNITISNCVVKPSRDPHAPIYGQPEGIAGLSLEIVDGGVMDGVSIGNIVIEGTGCPLYVRLGNRARKYNINAPEPPVGVMRNIVIDNVVARHSGNYCSSITGIPGHAVENLSLSNIQFFNIGGLTSPVVTDSVPEDEKGYPQPTMVLPSSGLFIRHAANVRVHGMILGSEQADVRTPVVAVDVDGLQVQGVGKIGNCLSPVFLRAAGSSDLLVERPLGWTGEVTMLTTSTGEAQPIGPNIHRVLFLGNSITYAGGYITDMEAYYISRHPHDSIEFINLGLPSETVSGLSEPGHAGGRFPRPDLHERLHRILEKIHPELIFACYGMNDGIYMPLDEGRFRRYRDGMQWLHDTLVKATGARVVFLTPPVYDELKGGKSGYAAVLDTYSNWLLDQRKKQQWEVADIHFPMKRYLEAHRKVDAADGVDGFALAADGIHPGEAGHWLIARQVLLYLGEMDVTRFPGIKQAMAAVPEGENRLKLVGERQSFMKDAWLSFTGHKRPEMKIGLPMEEAQAKAKEIEQQLSVLREKPVQ